MQPARTSSDATCDLLEPQVTLHMPLMQPCLKISIFEHQDATYDLLQLQKAPHTTLYNLVSKLEFLNTKMLHAICYNVKRRYMGPCAHSSPNIYSPLIKYQHYKSISFKLIRAGHPFGGPALRARCLYYGFGLKKVISNFP